MAAWNGWSGRWNSWSVTSHPSSMRAIVLSIPLQVCCYSLSKWPVYALFLFNHYKRSPIGCNFINWRRIKHTCPQKGLMVDFWHSLSCWFMPTQTTTSGAAVSFWHHGCWWLRQGEPLSLNEEEGDMLLGTTSYTWPFWSLDLGDIIISNLSKRSVLYLSEVFWHSFDVHPVWRVPGFLAAFAAAHGPPFCEEKAWAWRCPTEWYSTGYGDCGDLLTWHCYTLLTLKTQNIPKCRPVRSCLLTVLLSRAIHSHMSPELCISKPFWNGWASFGPWARRFRNNCREAPCSFWKALVAVGNLW